MTKQHSKKFKASSGESFGTGWIPSLPDFRDFTETTKSIAEFVKKLGIKKDIQELPLPSEVDLRQWCTPVENQGEIGSCTAQAAVGIVEYYQQRAFNKHIEGSRLFVYKNTRKILGWTGDRGGDIRSAMAAIALCGVAPEKYWRYTDKEPDFDREPDPFVYALADNFEALKYFNHDPLNVDLPRDEIISRIKKYLAVGVPSMFGFHGFESFKHHDPAVGIPLPDFSEKHVFSHAVVAVGYDDNKKITNKFNNKTTKGAILFRNSWGSNWGDNGYSWLPYDYIKYKIAEDFWSMLNMEWVDTDQFGI